MESPRAGECGRRPDEYRRARRRAQPPRVTGPTKKSISCEPRRGTTCSTKRTARATVQAGPAPCRYPTVSVGRRRRQRPDLDLAEFHDALGVLDRAVLERDAAVGVPRVLGAVHGLLAVE